MIGALTRLFGPRNLGLAEDVVQDAFCKAIEAWDANGVPQNPAAWLMVAAKNRALDILRLRKTATTNAPEYGRLLDSEWTRAQAVEYHFSSAAIKDDELRMMFWCCQPNLPQEGQIILILNVVGGFSAPEIAEALLNTQSAVERRLSRAKSALRKSPHVFEMLKPSEFSARVASVQRTLYLLFSEGYHGGSRNGSVRGELCNEAMRLTAVLLQYPQGATSTTFALSALMCLNAARLPGRIKDGGQLSPFHEQKRELWDQELLKEGLKLLEHSATGAELSAYHIEAAIAAAHSNAKTLQDIDWIRIAELYNVLVSILPTPIVALNRAVAIGQIEGPQRALEEIVAIADKKRLDHYPFYFAAKAEFELQLGFKSEARAHFQTAVKLARNPMEATFLRTRLTVAAIF